MYQSTKPVHKCHPCLLNLGDHCWIYQYPRGQWRHDKTCPGFENEALYKQFQQWQKQPEVKTRKELRKEYFRSKKRQHIHRDPQKQRW